MTVDQAMADVRRCLPQSLIERCWARIIADEVDRLRSELRAKQLLLDQWELLLGRKMQDILPDELAAEEARP